LNQGTLNLRVEPIGSSFYPTVKILDLRAAKSFTLGENWGKLEALLDVFNVNNSSAVLAVNNQTGFDTVRQRPTFGLVQQTLNPRIARLGARWTF
jgi:hypothetical protein